MMRRVVVRALVVVIAFNVVMALTALLLRRLIPSAGDEESDELGLAAAGNGLELSSRARAFRGGSVRAIMGGVELDLRNATLDQSGARLEVRAILGGVEIILPDDWPIRIAATRAIMGGVEHPHTPEPAAEEAALELAIMAIMGGVEVTARSRPPYGAMQHAPANS